DGSVYREEVPGAPSTEAGRAGIARGIWTGIQHGHGAARMALSVTLYLGLLAAVAAGRMVELRRSRRNQHRLRQEGASKADEPRYGQMVALHAGVLAGSAAEVVVLGRPLIPWLAIPALIVFLAANGVRWWAMRSLGARWNVQVMSVSALGVSIEAPYRWVRQPNSAAVFAEALAL